MHWRHSALEQLRTNHQKAVTMQGIFLGTHQCNLLLPRKFHNSFHFRQEITRLSAKKIVHQAVCLIDTRIGGPSSQGFSKEFISKTGVPQANFETFAIELREAKARRPASHVAHGLDSVF